MEILQDHVLFPPFKALTLIIAILQDYQTVNNQEKEDFFMEILQDHVLFPHFKAPTLIIAILQHYQTINNQEKILFSGNPAGSRLIPSL